jgi:anti-anti-sigma regulatory factor
MRTTEDTPVLVKRFPDCSQGTACRSFLRDLEALLSQSYQPRMVFDLSAISRMNEAGIELILSCTEEIAARDGELKLAAPPPQAGIALELMQINQVIEVFPSIEEALASFEARAPTESVRSGDATQEAE